MPKVVIAFSIKGFSMTQRMVLAGSTGLVGALVRQRLSAQADVVLVSLVRQGSSATGMPVDFEQLCVSPEATLKAQAPEGADVAICCLGTTLRAAGSKSAMVRVDHDYVLAFAKGFRRWVHISSSLLQRQAQVARVFTFKPREQSSAPFWIWDLIASI